MIIQIKILLHYPARAVFHLRLLGFLYGCTIHINQLLRQLDIDYGKYEAKKMTMKKYSPRQVLPLATAQAFFLGVEGPWKKQSFHFLTTSLQYHFQTNGSSQQELGPAYPTRKHNNLSLHAINCIPSTSFLSAYCSLQYGGIWTLLNRNVY